MQAVSICKGTPSFVIAEHDDPPLAHFFFDRWTKATHLAAGFDTGMIKIYRARGAPTKVT